MFSLFNCFQREVYDHLTNTSKKGHDLEKFHRLNIPATSNRLILQEQPHTIEKANPMPGIQKQAHDFFTEQPVKGARAYYLHSILHDWPDERAKAILEMLKPALKGKFLFSPLSEKDLLLERM